MPDATYVGAGMPCAQCGNPLTPGQPHKCGRVGNPYAPSADWKPGQDTFTAQAAGIWDEGFAAGRAAATPPDGTNPHDDRNRMTKQLLRPSEVAEILGVTTRTVRALAERGELVKVKLGRRSARYQLADVEQFIARHVVTPDNEGWAARAAATPDPPAANPWRNINVNHLPSVKLRDAWDDGWAAHAAASPDERLREALERIVDLPLVDDSDADRMREIAAEALPWKPGSDDPR